MGYNKPRRYKFRSNDQGFRSNDQGFRSNDQGFRRNDQGFRRNDSQDLRIGGINSAKKNFQRRSFIRNDPKPEKLLEKYNTLAKEALSNGDKILSENYYQHADHFLRVIEIRNSIHNNSKPHLDNSSIEKNSDDKIILKDEKNSSFPQPQNSEEI